MKKLIVLPIIMIALTACEKARELTQFTFETNSEVTIPAASGINLPINLFTPDVETNASSTFENNNTRADLIEEIRLDECELSILNPASANFDFLKTIRIYIEAEDLPEVLIAEREDMPNGQGQEVVLNATGADLTEYLQKSSFNLRVQVITDEVPNSDIDVNVRCLFFVDARVFGL